MFIALVSCLVVHILEMPPHVMLAVVCALMMRLQLLMVFKVHVVLHVVPLEASLVVSCMSNRAMVAMVERQLMSASCPRGCEHPASLAQYCDCERWARVLTCCDAYEKMQWPAIHTCDAALTARLSKEYHAPLDAVQPRRAQLGSAFLTNGALLIATPSSLKSRDPQHHHALRCHAARRAGRYGAHPVNHSLTSSGVEGVRLSQKVKEPMHRSQDLSISCS